MCRLATAAQTFRDLISLLKTDSRLSAALPDTCECYMIDYTGDAEEEEVEIPAWGKSLSQKAITFA